MLSHESLIILNSYLTSVQTILQRKEPRFEINKTQLKSKIGESKMHL